MNALPLINLKYSNTGYQDITADLSYIENEKGAIRLNVGGAATVYLPPSSDACLLPFFIFANTAHDYAVKENPADGTDTIVTLNSGGIAFAMVTWNGFEWKYQDATGLSSGSQALLNTLLTRNAATGIIQVTDSATLTASDQIVDLADDSVGGNAYTIKLPSPATLLAMPMLLLVSASNALVVTVQNSAAGAVVGAGTLTKGKEVGAIAYSDGTDTYVFPFMKNPVCGPDSSTDGDFARYDGTTGELLKGGIALDTTITAPGLDTEVPSSKALVTFGAATYAPIQTANAAVVADAQAIPASQHVTIITNAAANTIVLPLASTAVGRMYFIKTTVDEDTAVNEHADDGGSTIVTLKSSAIASAILCCDGTNWHEIHDT